MRKYKAALAVFGLALAGCGTVGEDEATITNSKPPTSTSETASSATETSSADEAQEESSSEENPEAEPAAEDASSPQGPQIASCATDPMLYERGTTWFTDGTSGWTQTCADQMPAAPKFDQDAYNNQFRDDYAATRPEPTFEPDSADGYGPNQELPPLCVRFPNDFDC